MNQVQTSARRSGRARARRREEYVSCSLTCGSCEAAVSLELDADAPARKALADRSCPSCGLRGGLRFTPSAPSSRSTASRRRSIAHEPPTPAQPAAPEIEQRAEAPPTPQLRELAAASAALCRTFDPRRLARALVIAFDADPVATHRLLREVATSLDDDLPDTSPRPRLEPAALER